MPFKIIFLLLGFFIHTNVIAADKVFSKDGFAIGGYDVMAYHSQNKAIKGQAKFSHVWKGANWIFNSLENRNRFAESPEQYAPQYGGFCVYAMSKGSLAPSAPNAWTIHNGKLYLNYSLSVRKLWQQKKDQYIKQADHHWRTLN